MKEIRTNVISVDFNHDSNSTPSQRPSTPVYDMMEMAFERDKRNAGGELTDFFVAKNRQEKAWYLINGVRNSLRQRVFSHAEARRITEFLAEKFDIRCSAIEYARALCFSRRPIDIRKKNIFTKRPAGGQEVYRRLFVNLQAAVQDNLLEYNDARSLVRDIIAYYPTVKDCLPR